MSLDISTRIQKLPQEKQKEFSEELFDDINDRYWCMVHNINYVNPDIQKAREMLFNESYAKYIPA